MNAIETATYRIIESFPDVEYHVRTAPITQSALDLSDEIKEKFNVRVSPATISNFRKKQPKIRIKDLYKERAKNVESLRFIVEVLKENLEEIEDPALELRYLQEMVGCIKEIDMLIEDEIKYLKYSGPF